MKSQTLIFDIWKKESKIPGKTFTIFSVAKSFTDKKTGNECHYGPLRFDEREARELVQWLSEELAYCENNK